MPRQMQLSMGEITEVVNKYVEIIFEGKNVIVGPSHTVWEDIRNDLNGKISCKSLYTILKCNRNDILCSLNIARDEVLSEFNKTQNFSDIESNISSDIDEIHEFKITLSTEEWKKINVHDVKYKEKSKFQYNLKNYTILAPGIWTTIIHSHFWEQTKIPCSVSYKRAKVYINGVHYCEFYGQCTSCYSKLKGVLENKPQENSRAIFDCKYEGKFNSCENWKKRRITSEQRKYFLEKVVTNKMSSAFVQRLEADKLMNFGDQEPSNLPTTNALRIAKYKALKEGRENNDPVLAVCMMKNMHLYLNIIKDIGYDRFLFIIGVRQK